jgi:hypothetical protein
LSQEATLPVEAAVTALVQCNNEPNNGNHEDSDFKSGSAVFFYLPTAFGISEIK